MKLYAPKYYKDFICLADRCRHSCCIGWEIDIDGKTMEKYSHLSHPYARAIRDSIDASSDTLHFRLAKDERCPHLDECGLCKIITNLTDKYLCDICREHPRFYNFTSHGKEVGLGMACEEAARIILSSENYDDIVVIGDAEDTEKSPEFDTLPYRESIFKVLRDKSISYSHRLEIIAEMGGVTLSILSDTEWQELLSSLEYLDNSHKALFSKYTSLYTITEENEKILERFFAYLIYRYVTAAESETELSLFIGTSLFLERLFASLLANSDGNDAVTLARIISEEIEYSEENIEEIKLSFLF